MRKLLGLAFIEIFLVCSGLIADRIGSLTPLWVWGAVAAVSFVAAVAFYIPELRRLFSRQNRLESRFRNLHPIIERQAAVRRLTIPGLIAREMDNEALLEISMAKFDRDYRELTSELTRLGINYPQIEDDAIWYRFLDELGPLSHTGNLEGARRVNPERW